MNTVFKFGLQAWQLFALASAFAPGTCGGRCGSTRLANRARPGRKVAAVGFAAVMVVLLFGGAHIPRGGNEGSPEDRFGGGRPDAEWSGVHAEGALPGGIEPDEPGRRCHDQLEDDRPLIDWLRDNVQGSPVIAEEVGPLYHWTGRISEYTGLPAVIGWDWHQIQQRTDYQDLVDQRRADTDRSTARPQRLRHRNTCSSTTFVRGGGHRGVRPRNARLAGKVRIDARTEGRVHEW